MPLPAFTMRKYWPFGGLPDTVALKNRDEGEQERYAGIGLEFASMVKETLSWEPWLSVTVRVAV